MMMGEMGGLLGWENMTASDEWFVCLFVRSNQAMMIVMVDAISSGSWARLEMWQVKR